MRYWKRKISKHPSSEGKILVETFSILRNCFACSDISSTHQRIFIDPQRTLPLWVTFGGRPLERGSKGALHPIRAAPHVCRACWAAYRRWSRLQMLLHTWGGSARNSSGKTLRQGFNGDSFFWMKEGGLLFHWGLDSSSRRIGKHRPGFFSMAMRFAFMYKKYAVFKLARDTNSLFVFHSPHVIGISFFL